MKDKNIERIVNTLDDLSLNEWIKIKLSIDNAFNTKRKEQEKNLKLSSNEINESIHSQFG